MFHTAGDPPSRGNRIFPNRGCRTNINDALKNKVAANKKIKAKLRSVLGDVVGLIIIILGPLDLGVGKLMIMYLDFRSHHISCIRLIRFD